MSEELVRYFAAQGPFALLFILLLWWVLKESARREDRLISSLEKITAELSAHGKQLDGLAHDVQDIKQQINQRGW